MGAREEKMHKGGRSGMGWKDRNGLRGEEGKKGRRE